MDYDYSPDKWVVIKMPTCYKVLGAWCGGYANGDSWRMNSGISKAEKVENGWLFHGYSGSVYFCHEQLYGFRMISSGIYSQLKEKFGDHIQLVDEETDWEGLDYDD